MDDENAVGKALSAAVSRLLRPLVRLLLRHSVPFSAFEELAKQAYVDVAMTEFGIPGKRATVSRVSVLSGLTRKDVQRLVAAPVHSDSGGRERHNRAAKVLSGWARDADFVDEWGAPRLLDPTEGPSSFAVLVKRYSGDMPARAVLDELLRVGAVQRHDDRRLELVNRAYVPMGSEVDKLLFLGTDVSDLIHTIDHNIQHGATEPRFQRKVMYRSFPAAAMPEFRRLGADKGQALLVELDRWLAAHDIDNPPDHPELPRFRVGVGVYHFEEPVGAPDPKEE